MTVRQMCAVCGENLRNAEQFQVQKTPLAGTSCQGCCCIVIRQWKNELRFLVELKCVSGTSQ